MLHLRGSLQLTGRYDPQDHHLRPHVLPGLHRQAPPTRDLPHVPQERRAPRRRRGQPHHELFCDPRQRRKKKKEKKKKSSDNCPKHDEALKWWCCTHAVPICAHCILLKEHPESQCDCKLLRTIADEARQELGGGPVVAKAEALKDVIAQNKAKAAELRILGETKKRDFRAAFDARVRTFEAEVDAAVARGCAEMVGPMTAAAEAALKTVAAVVAEQQGLAQLDDKTVMQRKHALAEKRQAAIAVNTEGLKAAAPDIKCALQPEEVVAAVAQCLPIPELVGVVPAVKIAGATGYNSGVVNGVYCPTGRLHNGKALFQKQDDAVRFLWYAPCGRWFVTTTNEAVEANISAGCAYTTTTGLDHPSLALVWRVAFLKDEWEEQPAVTITLV
jgi:hypothetical protein